MTLRATKVLLVSAVSFFFALIVFNNLTDYNTNYEFVRHVMTMDSTFPGNRGMWRAINSPILHTAFYWVLIGWEVMVMILSGWGAVRMTQALRGTAIAFHQSKRLAIVALALALLDWLVAFLAIGAEWFLSWQSKTWNGQDAAFRMFTVLGIVLLILALPDTEDQP